MKIEIKSLAGSLLFEGDFSSLLEAVVAAVKSRADLFGADLTRADLFGANLTGAYLTGAYLTGAYLTRANLSGANLTGAYLSRANLSGANLTGADLTGAYLSRANLTEEQKAKLYAVRTITPEGNIIGWKKLRDGVICRVLIPTDAKRVGGMMGRKCRAEFVRVLEGTGVSEHDPKVSYVPGQIVKPDSYDPNPMEECSHGIHFFITRQEAEDFNV